MMQRQITYGLSQHELVHHFRANIHSHWIRWISSATSKLRIHICTEQHSRTLLLRILQVYTAICSRSLFKLILYLFAFGQSIASFRSYLISCELFVCGYAFGFPYTHKLLKLTVCNVLSLFVVFFFFLVCKMSEAASDWLVILCILSLRVSCGGLKIHKIAEKYIWRTKKTVIFFIFILYVQFWDSDVTCVPGVSVFNRNVYTTFKLRSSVGGMRPVPLVHLSSDSMRIWMLFSLFSHFLYIFVWIFIRIIFTFVLVKRMLILFHIVVGQTARKIKTMVQHLWERRCCAALTT